MVLRAAWAALCKRERDFGVDARQMLDSGPPVVVFGQENIPASGPYLLLANHYTRPGMMVWWSVFALSVQLQCTPRWVVAAGWTYPRGWRRLLMEPLTAWAFHRLAQVYRFSSMPPMPPRPEDALARAAAVRSVLTRLRSEPNMLLGLMPEGRDLPGGVLGWPPAGAGRFMLRLGADLGRILPAGVYEADSRLCVCFGPLFQIQVPQGLPAAQQDQAASRCVMEHIAALLPKAMRGPFGCAG
jgi:hypothetical protein